MTLDLPDLSKRTVPAVLAGAARAYPDKLALCGPDGCYTYQELIAASAKGAGGFAALDVGRQQNVLLMLDNHLDYVLSWLALSHLAAVEVPVNTAYFGDILLYIINDSGAEVLVVDDRYCERLAEVRHQLTSLRTVVVRGDPRAGECIGNVRVVPYDALFDGPEREAERVDPWDLVGLMYTSGTTGPSKGVRVTHAHAYGYASPAVVGAADEHDTAFVALPLFHVGGQWAGVYNAFIANATAAVMPAFRASTFWDEVREYGCTYALILGAMANFILRQPPRDDDAANPLLRALIVPVTDEAEQFAERFNVSVGTAYGSTEASTVIATNFGEVVSQACGVLRPDFEARIVDENDLDVPRGQAGELLLRPREPWVTMAGYHGMPDQTAAAWRNLWFHTGDAFREDGQGRLHFVDRMKDALRRRGENVSSFEVEVCINKHPSVLESAVVGVASEHTEDEILAVVVCKPGETLEEADLILFLRERLPYFMVPRYIELRDALPKTPTQKVMKSELRRAGVSPTTWDAEKTSLGTRRNQHRTGRA